MRKTKPKHKNETQWLLPGQTKKKDKKQVFKRTQKTGH